MNEETLKRGFVAPSPAWPLRPALLALLLGLCALGVHFSLSDGTQYADAPVRQALAAFFFFGCLAVAFSIERLRWIWAGLFGLVAGLTLAGITWWVAGYGVRGFEWNWAFGSGLVALAIATPLFQTVRDAGRWAFEYDRLHFHAWTDAVIALAALAFTGISWLLLLLLSGLFGLIGFDGLERLMREGWFGWSFSGLAFGAALGILRENDRVMATLQRVVLIILSILAPPLAIGLVLFLVLLLFTGLDTLWDATEATTPILLACAAGAMILANAIIRNNNEEASDSQVLNISALALGATILPLGVIAAVSMGLRVDQYGLTPSRLWGVLVTAIACAYGLAYLVAIIAKRRDWAEAVRPANVRLAIALCAVALILALPLADFGAISARDQIARLESGAIAPEKFDVAAFAFEFGPSGRAALKALEKGQGAAAGLAKRDRLMLAGSAKRALGAETRWELMGDDAYMLPRQTDIEVRPRKIEVPEGLRRALEADWMSVCHRSKGGNCILFWRSGETKAIAVRDGCATLSQQKKVDPNAKCEIDPEVYELADGDWRDVNDRPKPKKPKLSNSEIQASLKAERDALDRGDIEIRTVTRQQLYLDDKPIGPLFE